MGHRGSKIGSEEEGACRTRCGWTGWKPLCVVGLRRLLSHGEMANVSVHITREALYEKVWSKPISKIASRFNLSDRGLGKLCARYDIPVPPRGWWAKKRHGHKVKQVPLPPSKRTAPITIHKQPASPTPPNPESASPEIAFEQMPRIESWFRALGHAPSLPYNWCATSRKPTGET